MDFSIGFLWRVGGFFRQVGLRGSVMVLLWLQLITGVLILVQSEVGGAGGVSACAQAGGFV